MPKLFHLPSKQRGFTLAEMAIVVVIAGILVTMGLKMTMANLTNAAYSSTVSKQAQIKIALINYLRTNGKLPCPDMTAVPNPPTGQSPVAGCAGPAAAAYGVLPWLTLNISRDTAIDGWGNFFVYRVANGLPSTTKNWTSNASAATSFDIGQLNTPSPAITVQQRDPVTGLTTITLNAVAVVLSGGNNGYGMRTQQGPQNAAVPAADKDETTNTNAALNTFVVGPYSTAAAGGGPYDDVVSYLVPQDLLQPLVAEQFISSCRTYCTPCVGSGNPIPACLGPNLPPIYPASCTVPATSHIPVGNPNPVCP